MSWILLSLVAAVSLATADALTKKYFSSLHPLEMGLVRMGYALPWLVPVLLFIPWPKLDLTFWIVLSISLPLEILALVCYMKALKVSPLSLSLPFLAFTPAFVILTGWLILGEKLSAGGFCGLILIVIGSYGLNLSMARTSFWSPLKAIFEEPGSRLILLVSLLYSFTSTLGKLALIHSSPIFFAVIYYFFLTLILSSLFPFIIGNKSRHLLKKPRLGLLVGAVQALLIMSHLWAISMVQAAYMLSVKRTSLLFGVLYGAWWFQEVKIKERLVGAVIMMIGVILIGWWG
jgi:drug/metabolite transporter (DMT)-like permease